MTTLGKYKVLDRVGRGGFAIVYKARDPDLDRVVALKVLAPHLTWDPTSAERFRREAQATARLAHPNIVVIYEVGEDDEQLYIAMAYLAGRTLAQVLDEEGAMPLERALPILEQAASALDYAHTEGVLHRDVKPSNMMVGETPQGEVWVTLMDFGLVKAMESSESLTSMGAILGSPEYMAPEQADRHRAHEIGPATDLYALGVVAYEMLVGKVPFPGNTPSTLVAHIQEPPPDPQTIRHDLPDQIAGVLLKALSKRGEDRYATAGELVQALRLGAEAQGQAQQKEARLAGLYAQIQDAIAAQDWAAAEARCGELLALEPDDGDVQELCRRVRRAREQDTAIPPPPVPAQPPGGRLGAIPAALSSRPWLALAVIAVSLLAGIVLLRVVPPLFKVSPTPAPTKTAVVALPPTPPPTPTDTPSPSPITIPPPCTTAGDTWTRPTDGMEMVCVPAGEFLMGSAEDDLARPGAKGDETPQHTVYLDAFWIDKTEVTNTQYRECVEAGACEEAAYWDDDRFNTPDQPVVGVSWYDAQAYAAWVGGRLPTEAEWEKAARGTGGRLYPWGDNYDGSQVNYCDASCRKAWRDTAYDDGYALAAPVGSYPAGASPYGVLDMAGNVWEWCQSLHTPYPYKVDDGREDLEADGDRVLRGGSWYGTPNNARCAYRKYHHSDFFSYHIGFRVVVSTTLPRTPTGTPSSVSSATPSPVPARVWVVPPLAEVSVGWSMGGGNPSNSSWNAAEQDLSPPLQLVWEWQPDASFSIDTVTYKDGIIYICGTHENEDNAIYAVEVGADQALALWSYSMPEAGGACDSHVAIGDGMVYFGGQTDDSLYCADAYTGEIIYTFAGTGGLYTRPPTLYDGVLFVPGDGSGSSGLFALGAETCERLWAADLGRTQAFSAVAGSLVLAASRLDHPAGTQDLTALDRQTGEIVWQTGLPRGNRLATDNQRAYVVASSADGQKHTYPVIVAYDLASGKEVWRHEAGFDLGFFARLAVTTDRLFVASSASDKNALLVFDTGTGSLLHQIEQNAWSSGLAAANGVIYTASGRPRAYDMETLDLLWEGQSGGIERDLAIADGYLFVATRSMLRAYR